MGRAVTCTTDCGDDTILDGFRITGGSIEGNGGGMYNEESAPVIRNCHFYDNVALSGGGMYNDNASPTIVDCVFESNRTRPPYSECGDGRSTGHGGAMVNAGGEPTIERCAFVENLAGDGGYGRDCPGEDIEPSGGNGGNGGAMVNSVASPTIIDTIFLRNTAGSGGGGHPGASGNGGHGGGMFNGNSGVLLINCVFQENGSGDGDDGSISGNGGAIYSVGSTIRLMNNTLYGNYAGAWLKGYGETIYDRSGVLEIINTIIWGESASATLHIEAIDGTLDISNSDIDGAYEGMSVIRDEPLFVDPTTDDLSLASDSPCIDVGLNVDVTRETDLAGNPRIVGGTVDMGAYERQ